MNIQENTVNLFSQDKEYVLDYLKFREVDSKELFDVIKTYPFGLLTKTRFKVQDEEFDITHFLSKSDISGYDIRSVNRLLNTESTNTVAFALVAGDDLLCYDTETKEVFLWLIQTGDGKKLHVSSNLDCFLKRIK